jgi:signal transduction histidine kinase
VLHASDGVLIPAQVSIRRLEKDGSGRTTFALVVTDMTEARRNEEMLRALSRGLVHAQEAERARVALELHDHITQQLCAILVRSQALADGLSARDGSAKNEAIKLREMLGATADDVERISRNLRPSAMDELGLVAVLRGASKEFTERTGVPVKLALVPLASRLPAEAELALYRICQEALKNVDKHARARRVAVSLSRRGNSLHLTVRDDGIGFDPKPRSARGRGRRGLGLLGMRERATYVGGTLEVTRHRSGGTSIEVRVPLT